MRCDIHYSVIVDRVRCFVYYPSFTFTFNFTRCHVFGRRRVGYSPGLINTFASEAVQTYISRGAQAFIAIIRGHRGLASGSILLSTVHWQGPPMSQNQLSANFGAWYLCNSGHHQSRANGSRSAASVCNIRRCVEYKGIGRADVSIICALPKNSCF